MRTRVKLFIVIFSILIAGAGMGTYFYISHAKQVAADNKAHIEDLSGRYQVSEEYIKEKKEELKEWNLVNLKLMSEKHGFDSEAATKLKDEGYLAEDIAKAQQLSVQSGVDKVKILKTRGRYPATIPWDDVIQKLKLDLRDDAEKMGLSKKDIQYFESKGLEHTEIVQLGIMNQNGYMRVKEMKEALNRGKSADELYQDYFSQYVIGGKG